MALDAMKTFVAEIVIVFLITALMVFIGSQSEELGPITYGLKSGDVVTCEKSSRTECGLSLSNCHDGKEYFCQKDYERMGPEE